MSLFSNSFKAAWHDGNKRALRVVWLLLFAGFFGLAGAWAVAMPVGGTTDEAQHIIRAYGVVSGQILSKPGMTWYQRAGADFTVPASLALTQTVDCMYHTEPGSLVENRQGAECQSLTGDTTPIPQVGSWVGRYHPAFYALTGLPLLLKPGYAGIVATRLLSAAICAAMLAFAGAVAIAARRPFLLTGILFAAPPTAVSLMGAVNPNGMEIAAGILLWTLGLAMVRSHLRHDETALRWLIRVAALAGIILVTVRQTGPLLMAVIAAIVGLAAGWQMCVTLAKRKDVRIAALLITLAVAGSVGWSVLASAYEMSGISTVETDGPSNAAFALFNFRLESWLVSSIGMFGYSDTFVPAPILFAWCTGVLTLILPVLFHGPRRNAATVVAAFAGALGLLASLDVRYLDAIGWSQTGRYVLAVAAGATICAAFGNQIARSYGTTGLRRFALVLGGIFLCCQLYSLAMTMSRFQKGANGGINPLRGTWFPLFGPILPIVMMSAGLAVLLYLAWQTTHACASARPKLPHPAPAPEHALGAAGRGSTTLY